MNYQVMIFGIAAILIIGFFAYQFMTQQAAAAARATPGAQIGAGVGSIVSGVVGLVS